MLIGRLHAPGVYSFHVREIHQCSKHWFYCLRPYPTYSFGIVQVSLNSLMHPVVIRFVGTLVYLLEFGLLTEALCLNRAALAVGF